MKGKIKVKVTGLEFEFGNWLVRIAGDVIEVHNTEASSKFLFDTRSNGFLDFENGLFTGTLYSGGIHVRDSKGKEAFVYFRDIVEKGGL
jgi:membrane-bound inhibitor of C-type lysozyme